MICLFVLLHIAYWSCFILILSFSACVLFVYLCFYVCSWTIYHWWNILDGFACFYIWYTLSVFKHCSLLLDSTVQNPVLWTRNNVVSWENNLQAARNNRTKAKSTCLCLTPFMYCIWQGCVWWFLLPRPLVFLGSEILVNEGYGSFFLPLLLSQHYWKVGTLS